MTKEKIIKESERVLNISKIYIYKRQKNNSDYENEFRKNLVSKGILRESVWKWLKKGVYFKTKNINRVKELLTELGEII